MAGSSPPEGGAEKAAPIAFIDLKAQQARIRPALDRAIARVLDHGAFIMGPEVAELEARLARFCGARHAIGCSSGTDALLIALLALGIGRGDAVVSPGFTFPATPEAIALLGATPVFAEVDEATFNVDPGKLGRALAAAKARGLVARAIIAVDLFGQPADYDVIGAFAAEHGLVVVADAAQSFGGEAKGRRVGTLARVTATSFFPAKPLGGYGDGGAIFTDDDGLADAMRSIRLHGKGRDKYDIVRVGVNGRLDTLQAAILIEKLAIFADEIALREAVARRYSAALAGIVKIPVIAEGMSSVWAQYTIRVPPDRREGLIASLAGDGIPAHVYYPRALSEQPAYRDAPFAQGGIPVCEGLAREVLSLPMHPYLSETDQARVIVAVTRALRCR